MLHAVVMALQFSSEKWPQGSSIDNLNSGSPCAHRPARLCAMPISRQAPTPTPCRSPWYSMLKTACWNYMSFVQALRALLSTYAVCAGGWLVRKFRKGRGCQVTVALAIKGKCQARQGLMI